MSGAMSLRLACVMAALQMPVATTSEIAAAVTRLSGRERSLRVICTSLNRMERSGLVQSARKGNRSVWTAMPKCETERARLEAENSGRGAPTKFCAEVYAQIKALGRRGDKNPQIARAIGVSESTLKRWLSQYPELAASVRVGRRAAKKQEVDLDADTAFDWPKVRRLGVGEWRAELPAQAVSSIFDMVRP
jgi:hypothetical protein